MSKATKIRKIRFFNFAAFVLLVSLIGSGPVLAQGDPRSNVNVVGMTPDPADFPDRRYRQQNEPACAVRPGDSACIICAYNDYRAVDSDIGFGDAWEGVSQSCDAGDTWLSRLAPGHPLYEPVSYRIPAGFAADPRLAAIPGMAIFNFIAGYRDTNAGVLAIQHWLEVNKEDADFYEPGVETYIADEGTSGRFLDKPDMVAVLDGGTITLDTVMENSDLGTISRTYPSGKLYVAYAVFTGSESDSQSVKVLVKTSDDWGRTFKNQAMKLSESQNQVSGITLTAIGNKVLAVWRRKGDGNDVDSIMYSVISNGGKKATKGEVLADICAFDQPTLTGTETDITAVAFRTNDFPWTANDGDNAFVFYSDRGRDLDTGECLADGKPRIVMHHSNLSGQVNWNDHGPIDQTADDKTFQFMPTAFGANGKVQVAWYDTRRDPGDPINLAFVADYDVRNELGYLLNRTVDVFTTNVTIADGVATIPAPVRASQFSIVVGEDENTGVRTNYETEASFANKKLFAQGKAPFLGDYIAIAAREYRRNSADTAWESNASAVLNQTEDFFVAWTDNRDVRGTIANSTGPIGNPLEYSYDPEGTTTSTLETGSGDEADQLVADAMQDIGPPRDTTQTAEGIDGTDPRPGSCVAETARTRDANIYGSLIKDRARMYAPNPSKPLGTLQRAFPVVLSNSEDIPKVYTLKIVADSCPNCKASFRQELPTDSPELNEPPLTILDENGFEIDNPNPFLIVPAKSSLARTVFVAGNQAPVKVEARDETGTLVATIQLANAAQLRDPENCAAAQLADPTVACSVAENELHNLELQTVDVHLLALLTNQVDALAADQVLGVDASSLIDWAVAGVGNNGLGDVDGDGEVDGACCEGEEPPTYGSVIEYANKFLAFETRDIQTLEVPTDPTDANLLNAALLNANLLNANLLNANLLNANLLNASLLNASLLNSSPTDLTPLGGPSLSLVLDAEAGGCCEPPLLTTYGDVIMWHISNPELSNANLLNAPLLNAALLNANLLNLNLANANLLNANLLNASLLNASLLNATLLNASLLNAALLNPTVEAAALLNANLLNADLLNASLLNPTLVAQAIYGGCCGDVEPEAAAAADVIKYAVGHPEIINASLLNASLLNANLLNANLLNANLLNANLLNANLLNANLLNANLLNANLLNANLLNANLLNADLLNANLLNANLLNSSLTDIGDPDPVTGEQDVTAVYVGNDDGTRVPYTGDVTFDDYTYPITNNGNVTTAIDTDITINAPTVSVNGTDVLDVIGTKLIVWTTNATPTVVDCVERVQLNTRVQSITSPDSSFDVADITRPFEGQASAVVAPGETAFVTLRVIGSIEQLKKVRVSGFTASSQAANCYATVDGPVCDTRLNEGVEQITFADMEPPVITVPADITVEATSAAGAVVDYTVTVFDAADANPSLECLPGSGELFDLGTTTVNCGASDASGNEADSAFFDVIVQDTTDPTIAAPADVELEANGDPTSTFGVTDFAPDGAATGSDIFGVVITSETPVGGFVLGGNTVTWTATDGNGRTATAIQTVTVEDTTDPTITAPAAVTLEANGDPTSTFDDTDFDPTSAATGSDIFGVGITYATPFGGFVLGGNTVTWTATDSNGNNATAPQTVTVVDTTPPTITAPIAASVEANGNPTSDYSCSDFDTPTNVFDIFGTTTVDCSPTTGLVLGENIITWTVADGNGLTASTPQTVTVVDTSDPIIDPVIPNIGFEPMGTYPYELSADLNTVLNTVTVSWPVSVTDSDPNLAISCSIDGLPATLLDGPRIEDDKVVARFEYEFGPGNTMVSCTATDGQDPANGGVATFEFTVSVFDITAPEISVPSITTEISLPDENGSFEYDYSSLVSVSDNADADPILECRTDPDDNYSTNFVDLFSYGETTVECRAFDHGPADETNSVNESTAQFVLSVRFPYDIDVSTNKTNVKLGSTIPIDWFYIDWDNPADRIDSSQIDVGITWNSTSNCLDANGSGPSGEDSGSSEFRYSASSSTWQYSLQTKDLEKGKYLVSITPPGVGVENARVCITLR